MSVHRSALFCTFALLAVLAVAAPGSGRAADVDVLPGRIVITVSPGVSLEPAAKTGGISTGVAAIDELVRRFAVSDVQRLYPDVKEQLGRRFAEAQAAGKSAGGAVDLGFIDRTFEIAFPPSLDLQTVMAAFAGLPEVAEAHPVELYRSTAYLPNDPGISGTQWYLRNMTEGGADVRAVGGWNQTLGDTNIVIAVVDGGVAWTHPDLGGPHPDKVNGAIWTNWAEYYGTPGVDDDGNNFIDDIRGWDFVNAPGQGYPGEDDSIPDNDPMDFGGHGTAVAGCAAAITNNGIGIAGTAPGCKIMAMRAGFVNTAGVGVLPTTAISQAMIYAAANGADVLNASFGPTSSFLRNAVQSCQIAGVLIVHAAGNDDFDTPGYLDTVPGILSVAATNPDDAKATFSNFGDWIDVCAPGTGIYTTSIVGPTGELTYSTVQGTSFSAPITAGAAALVWSANPGLSYTQIGNLLKSSADNIDALNPGYVGLLGTGRVNLLKALGDNLHRFPSEFPTLFDAINESAPGDTVGVEAGTVIAQSLTVPDRGIKFFGGYNADYTSRDPLGTPATIQGSLSSSALRFLGGVGPDTEVDGFLIQGGGGLAFSGIPYTGRYGGGVMVNGTSPTLRNLVVTGNSVGSAAELGCGGGIALNGSSSLLENVTVNGNTGVFGAGIFAYQSTATLVGCTVEDNLAITDNLAQQPRGGGVHAVASDLTLVDCSIGGHADLVEGGGVYLGSASTLDMTGGAISGNTASGKGGGIFQSGGQLTLHRVAVTDNLKGAGATFATGGGLYLNAVTASLDSLTVTGNAAHAGGGVALEACPDFALTNSVLAGNTADIYGGGIYANANTAVALTGNTIAENAGTSAGAGGVYATGGTFTVANTIIALNTGGAAFANGFALGGGTATFTCNDVFGNATADYSGVTDPTGTAGNIALDPLFCAAGNYDLKATSPCHPDNSGACGLIGALNGGSCVSAVPGEGDGDVPLVFRVDQAFPNPFNPRTTIRFALPEAGRTTVSIFDVKGRHVATLLNDDLPAQRHEVTWTGRDENDRPVAAGVYFYMVASGQHHAVGRMALVK